MQTSSPIRQPGARARNGSTRQRYREDPPGRGTSQDSSEANVSSRVIMGSKVEPTCREESQRMRDLFLANRQSGGLLKLQGMKPTLGMLTRDVLMAH